MGSLCCVAARPHGSSTGGSADWSNEAPLSEGRSSWASGGDDDDDHQLLLPHHHYIASDGSYFIRPAGSFRSQQLLLPPPVQGVVVDDEYESVSEPRSFSQFVEGTSGVQDIVGSVSSRSDDSEFESTSKIHASPRRSFSSWRSFMSKPIYPLSLPEYSDEDEESHGFIATTNSNNSQHSDQHSDQPVTGHQASGLLYFGNSRHMEIAQVSSSSSMDFTNVSEASESESLRLSHKIFSGGSRCGLCERLLSQKSPWGSGRMVLIWDRDMPIAAVLSCWHVYHSECLERTAPEALDHDPTCPICEKSENNLERLKNGQLRLKSVGEDGPSGLWTCGRVGDCVEGDTDVTNCSSSMLLRNRSCLKRQLLLKG